MESTLECTLRLQGTRAKIGSAMMSMQLGLGVIFVDEARLVALLAPFGCQEILTADYMSH
jgi:hypothetical protein